MTTEIQPGRCSKRRMTRFGHTLAIVCLMLNAIFEILTIVLFTTLNESFWAAITVSIAITTSVAYAMATWMICTANRRKPERLEVVEE